MWLEGFRRRKSRVIWKTTAKKMSVTALTFEESRNELVQVKVHKTTIFGRMGTEMETVGKKGKMAEARESAEKILFWTDESLTGRIGPIVKQVTNLLTPTIQKV